MPARKDAATQLAEQMLQVLEAQRQLGPDSYPLTLRRLAELTDPTAPPDLIQKAAGKKKLFGTRVLAAFPKGGLDSLAAFSEDADRLAACPALLESLLDSLCTMDNPICEVGKLKGKVPSGLKQPLDEVVRRHIEQNTLPPGVAVVSIRDKPHLHLKRYPLPKPPDLELAENLIRVLMSQRQVGGDAYPLRFEKLIDLTRPGTDPALLKKALARPEFQGKALLALPKLKDPRLSPVALVEDGELLAASPLMLEATVNLTRSDTKQVCTIADMKKKVAPALQRSFEEAVSRWIEARSLPATVGCLLQAKGKHLLFLMSDVITNQATCPPPIRAEVSRPATAPPPAPVTPAPFAQAFDAAFARLEGQKRTSNYVSLVELRRALPCDRQTFDHGLHELRRAGRYTLSAAEGRHGISPEEQQAGIVEDGALLLHVSRRPS